MRGALQSTTTGSARCPRARARWPVAVILACLSLALAPGAFAAAPVLAHVGQTSGHASASWTLPAGEQSELVEVASSPATGSDGFFFDDSVVDMGLLSPGDRSWLSSFALAPGTYYIHVKGEDADQDPFSGDWSNVLTLLIPGATSPPPAPTVPVPTTPDPVVPATPIVPVVVPPAATSGRLTKLWFSQGLRGTARARFGALQPRIYANLGWRTLPLPNSGFRLVWVEPRGRTDREWTSKAARLGDVVGTSIPNVDFRRRPGRWRVKLEVGTSVIATGMFVVTALPVRKPAPKG